jgi:hypothetical protein
MKIKRKGLQEFLAVLFFVYQSSALPQHSQSPSQSSSSQKSQEQSKLCPQAGQITLSGSTVSSKQTFSPQEGQVTS